MHCKKCGAELLDWAKVCVICGAPATDDPDFADELASEEESDKGLEDIALDEGSADGFTIVDDLGDTFATSDKVFPDDFKESTMSHSPLHVDYLDTTVASNKVFPDDFKESTMSHAPLTGEVTERIDSAESESSAIQTETYPSMDTFVQDSYETTDYGDNTSYSDYSDDGQKRGKGRAGAIIAVACAAAAIAACGFVMVPSLMSVSKADQSIGVQQKKANDASSLIQSNSKKETSVVAKTVSVLIPMKIEGLNENGSRIPVHVKGSDINNAVVDINAFVDAAGAGLELLPGKYEVRMIASPIAEDGTMYHVTEGVLTIVISSDGNVSLQPEGVILEIATIPATDVTDENIELSRTWIAQDPLKSELADTLAERARSRKAPAPTQTPTQNTETRNENNTNSNEDEANNDYSYNQNDYYDYNYTPSYSEEEYNNNDSSGNSSTSSETTPTVNPGDGGGNEGTNPGSDGGNGNESNSSEGGTTE